MMMPKSALYVILALAPVGLAGCSSDPTGVQTGALAVETEAFGQNIPRFSTLNIEGLASTEILTDGGQEVTPLLPAGPREVRLDVAANCTVEAPNPRTVQIRAAEPNLTTFRTTCS